MSDAFFHGHGGAAAPPPYGSTNQHNYNYAEYGSAYVPRPHPWPVVIYQKHPSIAVVKKRPRYRFCKTFIVAVSVWILAAGLLRHLVHLWHSEYDHDSRPHWSLGPADQSPDYPLPPDIDLLACEEPLRNGRGRSFTSFEVASPSETLLLLSAGERLGGFVQVTTSSTIDSVKFSVTGRVLGSRWDHHTVGTIVCTVKRKEGEFGVGIFNPRRFGPHRFEVIYDVLVELPESYPHINRFETNVVNTQHHFGDLQDRIYFENLSLRGTNGAIKVESLAACWANIITTESSIEGAFNASDELVLATSNSHIDVNVDFNQLRSTQARLSIVTDNSHLYADISLYDLRPTPATESNFFVTTETTNSRLDVAFLDAPVDSILTYRGTTDNSPVHVELHPTFEGHFTLDTSRSDSPIIHQRQVADPAGKGRIRYVTYNDMRGHVEGDISWGATLEGRGSVDVSTTNSKITLNV